MSDRDRHAESSLRLPDGRLAARVTKAREALELAQAARVMTDDKVRKAYLAYVAARDAFNRALVEQEIR